jgi:lambda family phage portal protein
VFERIKTLFSRPAELPSGRAADGGPAVVPRDRPAGPSLTRSLEAATPRRPIPGDHVSPFEWSSAASSGIATVRARSRHAAINDQWFSNGVAAWPDHAVGTGITPASQAPDANFRAAAAENWNRWVDSADADQLTDFYGQQAAACQSCVVDGEALAVLGMTETGRLTVRLLNADQLDSSKTADLGAGRCIVNGIEFLGGSRIAYWIRPLGPQHTLSLQSVRVDAASVVHLSRPNFIGSIRGLPWGASVLLSLNEMAQLTDALLVAAKISAMLMGFVIDQNSTGPNPFTGDGAQIGSLLQGGLEPGTMKVLPSGYDVKFSTPQQFNSGIEQAKLSLRGIAAGLGVPEYIVTGDMSQANYSSLRAARLAFKRRVERFQHHQLIPMMLRPIWRRWLMLEVLSGRLPLPSFGRDPESWLAAEFYEPIWPSIDVQKDSEGEAIQLAAGLLSRRQALAARGYSVEQIDDEIAADQAREQSLGLNFTYGQGGAAESTVRAQYDDQGRITSLQRSR